MNQNSQTNLTIGILVATVVAAGGTYFAFDFLTGDKAKPQAQAEAGLATPVAENAPEPASTGSVETASEDPVSAATEAAVAAVGVEAGGAGLSEADARRIGEEVARQVAAQVAQSIVDQQLSKAPAGTTGGGLSAEEARRIGEEEGRRVAQEVVQTALAARSGSSEPSGSSLSAAEAEEIGYAAGKRAAQQVAASTARRVVREEFGGQPAAASEPSTQPAVAAREPAAVKQPAAPRSRPAKAAPKLSSPASDALKAWWPAASGGFSLVYAGQPKGEQAIALLFSSAPGEGALNQSVKVYDQRGALVSGSWEASANPRLAVFRGLKPGRYTVVVEAGLADSQGQSLGQDLHGPVYVI